VSRTRATPRPRAPAAWTREEEWYNFKSNPRGKVHVLVTFDESSTNAAPKMGTLDHPIAWCHLFRGGRVFYTAFGHAPESFEEPLFRAHLLGGIRWAAKLAPGDCGL
jgi:type 1 glutamine amidotransferase